MCIFTFVHSFIGLLTKFDMTKTCRTLDEDTKKI